MSATSTIRLLHRRFPWVPPLVVVTAAIATLVALETGSRQPVAARTAEYDISVDNDVATALKLLLRAQNITPQVFTCPTTQPMQRDFSGGANTALNWSNWNATPGSQKTMGYTYQNPFGKSSRGATGEVQSDK